jgi:hypothetical protein
MDQVLVLHHVVVKHANAAKVYGIYRITSGSLARRRALLGRTGTRQFRRVGSCPELSHPSPPTEPEQRGQG